jgi:hypothetical protein
MPIQDDIDDANLSRLEREAQRQKRQAQQAPTVQYMGTDGATGQARVVSGPGAAPVRVANHSNTQARPGDIKRGFAGGFDRGNVRRQSAPIRRAAKVGKIKILLRITRSTLYEYWIGGDREAPEKIYELPIAEDRGFARLDAIGPDLDDWIFAIKRSISTGGASAITIYGTGEQYIYDADPQLVNTFDYRGGGVWSTFMLRSTTETTGPQQTIKDNTLPRIEYTRLFDTHPNVVTGSIGGSSSFYSWGIDNVVGGSPGGAVLTRDSEILIPYLPLSNPYSTINYNQQGEQRATTQRTETTRASQNDVQAGLLSPYANCPPTPGATASMQAGQVTRDEINDFNINYQTTTFSVLVHRGQREQTTGSYSHTQNTRQEFRGVDYLGSRDVTISGTCVTFGQPTGQVGMTTNGEFYPQNIPFSTISFLETEVFDTDLNILLLPGRQENLKDRRARTTTTGLGNGNFVYTKTLIDYFARYGDAESVFWSKSFYDQNNNISSREYNLKRDAIDYSIDIASVNLFGTDNKLISTLAPENGVFSLYRCTEGTVSSNINQGHNEVRAFIRNNILSGDVEIDVTRWVYNSSILTPDPATREQALSMNAVNSTVDNVVVLCVQYFPS